MIAADCPNCGASVPAFAKDCGHCGAPNRARRAGFVVLAALLVLLIAIGVATFAVVRWQRLSAGTVEPSAPAAAEDFSWLTAAMKGCDAEASGAPSVLHFLVIPLAGATADDPQWRSQSLNDVGNAILLPSDTALNALRGGALKISADQYVFRVRDDATNTIYKWSPSTGVKRFSAPDTDAIEGFKLQFLTGDNARDDQWGASFVRRKGNCYWVNAIIGN